MNVPPGARPAGITEPGVYDMPAEEYFADPVVGGSLTSSGARSLLRTTPARWRYEQSHPTPPTAAMILGTAVHSLTLGAGPKIVEVDATDWRSKAAQAERDEAASAGNVPLLRADYRRAQDMAGAVHSHPVASALFTADRGRPEQVMVWHDHEFGVWRRSMVDHFPHDDGRRPIEVDLKTTTDASPKALAKTVANFGYHMQAAFYLDGYDALFPGRDPAFLFVFVEKDPPYLVSVVELDGEALEIGRARNREALSLYRDCVCSGDWPGHSPEIELVSLPSWAARMEEYR